MIPSVVMGYQYVYANVMAKRGMFCKCLLLHSTSPIVISINQSNTLHVNVSFLQILLECCPTNINKMKPYVNKHIRKTNHYTVKRGSGVALAPLMAPIVHPHAFDLFYILP